MGRFLAIDYGEKRIGIAVSDDEKKYAFARETIINKDIEITLEKIKEYCQSEGIEKIIIGLPFNMAGRETVWTDKIKNFAEKLKRKTGLAYEFQDERLTSRLSYSLFRDKRGGQKVSKNKINEQSARIILQDYIDRKNLS